jgi:hypothetical protein
MNWIVLRIKGVMLTAGVLTSTMLYAAVAPRAALHAEIVVRNWGALIGLIGAMLLYGAYHPSSRSLVLTVAGLSKVVFIGLVLSQGGRYLGHQAGIAVLVDSIFVLLFAGFLIGSRASSAPRAGAS